MSGVDGKVQNEGEEKLLADTVPRPFFSVVLPVFNGGPVFEVCLSALAASSFRDWELIVVDDGSSDDSAEIAEAQGAKLLETGGRLGPAAARNLGAAHARGEFLFFVDADCEVGPDTLAAAAEVLRADPSLEAMFGSYDDEPAGRTLVSRYKNLQHHFVHQGGREEASTFWAGCGAMRRSTFLKLGGFDTVRYPRPSIEDIELGYRLRAAGGRIRLAKGVQVKHHKVWTLLNLLRTDLFDRGIPWTELTLRDAELVEDLNLDRSSKASVVAVGVLLLSLAAAVVDTAWLWLSGVCLVALLALNADFYRFLHRKRGVTFAVACLPLHWLYYLYCGVAFVIGHLRYWTRRSRAEPAAGGPLGGPVGGGGDAVSSESERANR